MQSLALCPPCLGPLHGAARGTFQARAEGAEGSHMSRDFYILSNVICDAEASAQLSVPGDARCWQGCHPAEPPAAGEPALTLLPARAAPVPWCCSSRVSRGSELWAWGPLRMLKPDPLGLPCMHCHRAALVSVLVADWGLPGPDPVLPSPGEAPVLFLVMQIGS